MIRIFIGFDERQPVAYATLCQSLITHAKLPLSITPLVEKTLPIKRKGLTPFTFTRFLVPWLCDYEGLALFLDIDMMVRADISELFAMVDDQSAVMVVKNARRFEWASLMLFNCERCTILTPEYVNSAGGLHAIKWLPEDEIGELPPTWNHLVGYDEPRQDAKLVHFTQGIPAFPETQRSEHGNEWRALASQTFSSYPWAVLMGRSVHAEAVRAQNAD